MGRWLLFEANKWYKKIFLVLFRYLSNLSFEIVKNSLIKYRSNISRITLLGYLLVFVLNIFHVHKIDFKSYSNSQFVSGSELQSFFYSSENRCIVHQNFNSLHWFVISNSANFVSNQKKEFNLIFRYDDFTINCSIQSENHLRAPPLFSWLFFWIR